MSDKDKNIWLMSPITDKEHLQMWVKYFLGIELPDCTVSRYADSNPLEFVWDTYKAIMDGVSRSTIVVAGRESSKTIALSILDLLSMLHDKRSAVHIGMTVKQAERAREYIDQYIAKIDILQEALTTENKDQLTFKIDNETIGIELLPCKPKNVQGAHAALVTWDEIASSVEPEITKGYRDSAGIPGTSKKGKPAVTVKITSRQAGYSLLEDELKVAAKKNFVVKKWTTIDTMEKCPDERSGKDLVPMWINMQKGLKYNQQEFLGLPQAEQDGFERIDTTYSGCHKCPLALYCQGQSKNQTSKSVLLRKIDDVILKLNLGGSHDWAMSQLMSQKPSSEGLVYFEFDRNIHQPGWNKMWETLTGETPNGPITREMFIRELKERGAQFYGMVDWGWASPSTCVIVAVDKREICYVVEAMGRTYTSDPDFVILFKQAYQRKYNVQMYIPDIANGSGCEIIKQAGLPVEKKEEINKSISLGINVIKGLLKVPGTNNKTRIYFAPDLDSTVDGVAGIMEEFGLYHKKVDINGKIIDDVDPVDSHNHYLDALRYWAVWYFIKERLIMTTGATSEEIKEKRKNNVPRPDEILQQQRIDFIDNRKDFGKGDDDDDDDSGGDSGGGGMIFDWT